MPLFERKMMLLVYQGHRLREKESVAISDLRDEKMLIKGQGFHIFSMFQKKCLEAGFYPNIIAETAEINLCQNLCMMREGLSITVDFIAEGSQYYKGGSQFITPQGFSKGIKSLEAELGVTLLDRTPNGVSLTPYGECLMSHTNPMLIHYEKLSSEIKKIQHDLKGEPLILESHKFKIHDLVKERCQRVGFDANIIYCTSGFSLCHKLTAQKRGISVIVDRISDDMAKQGLKIVLIEDSFLWEVNTIYKNRNRDLKQIRRWKSYTQRYLRNQGLSCAVCPASAGMPLVDN